MPNCKRALVCGLARLILAGLIPAGLIAWAGAGCRGGVGGAPAAKANQTPVPAPCPPEAPALPVLPFSAPRHMVVDFWLAGVGAKGAAILLSPEQLRAHNEQIATQRREGWLAGRWDLLERPRDPDRVAARLKLQVKRLSEAVAANKRVLANGRPPVALARGIERVVRASAAADELRVAWRSTAIRCYPTAEAIYDAPWQLPFDLMQCSQLRYGEPVRVLRKAARYWYVWSSYTEGWVAPSALTPPLTEAQAKAYLRPARYVVVDRDRLPLFFARDRDDAFAVGRLGLRLPLSTSRPAPRGKAPSFRSGALALAPRPEQSDRIEVVAPRRSGLAPAWLPTGHRPQEGPLPLTRERLWRAAFALLDTPYGWGGTGGHRDCSRMLMDLFALFDLQLPRNSWQQGLSGVQTVEVEKLDEAAKVAAIERAGEVGLVLLYLPGHIMLYLGRDGDHLYALHQFSGFLSLCDEEGGRGQRAGDGKRRETMNRVNRATVTSLELGRGSSRRAFIERITRLVVFGPPAPATQPRPRVTGSPGGGS